MLSIAILAGCQDLREIGGGLGLDLPGFDLVYECQADELDEPVELCWDDGPYSLAQNLYRDTGTPYTCRPTSRHLGPCIYHCDGGRGCNATSGCYCP